MLHNNNQHNPETSMQSFLLGGVILSCGEEAFKRNRRQIRAVTEEKYSRIKTEGQKMITQMLESWRRGQEINKEGESKQILRLTRKIRHSVHSHEDISIKNTEERKRTEKANQIVKIKT